MTPLGSLDWRLARSGTVPWNARPSIGVSRESGFFSVQRPRAVFTLVVGLLPNTQQHIKATASHYYWPRERQRERQRENYAERPNRRSKREEHAQTARKGSNREPASESGRSGTHRTKSTRPGESRRRPLYTSTSMPPREPPPLLVISGSGVARHASPRWRLCRTV